MPQIEQERRGGPRIKPSKIVRVEYPDYQPHIRDLSENGAFIIDARPISRGHMVKVRLSLDKGETISGKAIVRRVEADVGMAVEFIDMSSEDRKQLHDFLGIAPKV